MRVRMLGPHVCFEVHLELSSEVTQRALVWLGITVYRPHVNRQAVRRLQRFAANLTQTVL